MRNEYQFIWKVFLSLTKCKMYLPKIEQKCFPISYISNIDKRQSTSFLYFCAAMVKWMYQSVLKSTMPSRTQPRLFRVYKNTDILFFFRILGTSKNRPPVSSTVLNSYLAQNPCLSTSGGPNTPTQRKLYFIYFPKWQTNKQTICIPHKCSLLNFRTNGITFAVFGEGHYLHPSITWFIWPMDSKFSV